AQSEDMRKSEEMRKSKEMRKPVQSDSRPKVREGDVENRREGTEQKGTGESAQKRREYKSDEHSVQTGESDRTNSQAVRRHPSAGTESESHSVTRQREGEGRTQDQTDYEVNRQRGDAVRPTDRHEHIQEGERSGASERFEPSGGI